jgi:Kef-type K+ transport system membrane component KefB
MVWPENQSYLFPPSSMPDLRLFSRIGVILYMFLVGIDLDLGRLRQKAHAAIPAGRRPSVSATPLAH